MPYTSKITPKVKALAYEIQDSISFIKPYIISRYIGIYIIKQIIQVSNNKTTNKIITKLHLVTKLQLKNDYTRNTPLILVDEFGYNACYLALCSH